MSRFGWAYVNDVITGSGGTPGGSDKAIQFASGSTFSGSTNFTFDYNTNTVRLTGTLYADNLIVSSSQILKSGSTIFGDDLLDTHQFTGSVYVTGVVSSSTGIQSAGAVTSQGIISSSLGFQTNTTVQAAGNITSQGIISSSNGFQTNTTVDAAGNIRSIAGDLSSSIGIQTGGFLTVAGTTNLKSGLIVTGSTVVQSLSSSAQIQATSFAGNGLGITGIQAYNVDGSGDDWSIQFKSGDTGTLTGSSNLLFSGSTLTLTGSLLMSGTSHISEVDYIDFDVLTSTPAYKGARLYYDANTTDLAYYGSVANQSIQIGQQTVIKVKNSSGSPISKGKLVHITGGVGDNPLINTASWENDSNSANTLGMLMSTVAHNGFGYVLLNGVLTGVNTNPATYLEGQVIYLSSSGDYTNVTPVAPYHTVRLGEVIRAHATVGSVFIKIDNGYEISELHDVLITSASTGDLLTYNSSSALWQNTKTLSGSYTLTGSLSLGSTSTLSITSGTLSTGATVVSHTIPSNAENFTISNEYNDKLITVESNATKDIVRIGPVSSTPGLTTEIYIQGNPGDAFLEVSPTTTFLSNLSGTTAQFTTVTGSTITGSTALFTTITGSTITGSTALFTTITGSTVTGSTALFTTITGSTALLTSGAIVTGSVYVNNGSVVARGLPSLESFMPKRSIQLFPLNNLMCSTMFNSTANTPFTENFATKAQNFDSNGRPFMTYTTAVSNGTAGFTTTDIGTTKVLCRSIANPNWRGFFKTGGDITTQRIFVGFEPYSASSRSADDPNFGYAFIQYSSVRGDTEFKIISKTQAGGTQVTASTGINVTANTNYFFDMVLASGSFTVTLTSGSTTTTTSLTLSLLHQTASVGVCSVMMPSAANSRDFSIYMLEFNDT